METTHGSCFAQLQDQSDECSNARRGFELLFPEENWLIQCLRNAASLEASCAWEKRQVESIIHSAAANNIVLVKEVQILKPSTFSEGPEGELDTGSLKLNAQ